jgi:hypothetical protein
MFTGLFADVCLRLCRVSTLEEEKMLLKNYALFGHIDTQQIGISSLFTLNNTSQLV